MVDGFRIGILQFAASVSKRDNLDKVRGMLSSSRVDADIIVLPEYSMADITGLRPEDVYKISEGLDGGWVESFMELSREYGSHILCTMFEDTGRPPKVYNTALIIKDDRILGVYRKIHLYDAYGFRESRYMDPGDRPMDIVDIGLKTGVAICFDIRFPELFRYYSLKGADMVIIPAGWMRGPMKEEALRTLGSARSHENTIFTVIAVQYSEIYTGRSMVIDPYGNIMYDAGIGEKYVEVEVDPGTILDARSRLPILKLINMDLYRLLLDLKGQ